MKIGDLDLTYLLNWGHFSLEEQTSRDLCTQP